MRPMIIENPYDARMIAAPIDYKDGKARRRDRRKRQRK